MADGLNLTRKTSRKQTKKVAKVQAPTSITLDLHAPGMTPLHRAGLGGLAATLRAMEQRHRRGRLPAAELPGGGVTWTISPQSVTLDGGEPDQAAGYLEKLFRFGFGLRDRLIDLPGTYRDHPPQRHVRAELQRGLTMTFLQHGKTRKLAKQSSPLQYDPNDEGVQRVRGAMRACYGYRHRDGWKELTDNKGRLRSKPVSVEGPISPGSVVRHNAWATQTKIEEPAERALCLFFALVGCLSLTARGGIGVLLVPEVTDLRAFARTRPRLTPRSARECQAGGGGDATLQALVRIRARTFTRRHGLAGMHVNLLRSTPWASQQKSRVAARFIPAADGEDDARLARFDRLYASLPPRVQKKEIIYSTGRGKSARTLGIENEWFWTDSLARPLFADNLARQTGSPHDRPFYDGLVQLYRDRETRQNMTYERAGLLTLVAEQDKPRKDLLMDHEMSFINAYHRALQNARGKIKADTQGRGSGRLTQATKNRMNRLMERIRLELNNAKTEAQVRNSVAGLMARSRVSELHDDQPLLDVKNLMFSGDWQKLRDLALLALASYQARPKSPSRTAADDATPDPEPTPAPEASAP